MKRRNFFVLAIIMLSLSLLATYSFGAVGSEESEQFPAYKAVSSKVGASKAVAAKTASTKVGASKAVAVKTASPKVEESKAAVSEARAKVAEMTKGEMLAALKEDLADNNEIFDMVPELKAAVSHQDGKAVYTFNGAALESLSKEDLTNLFGRVRNALVKIRTDRIQKQLETIKQVERLRVITSPQQPPHAPSTTPSVPKIPSSPPRR